MAKGGGGCVPPALGHALELAQACGVAGKALEADEEATTCEPWGRRGE